MSNLDLLVPVSISKDDSSRWATVTQVSPLRVKVDGETDALGFTPDALVSGLEVDDRVWVQIINRRLVVIGRSGGSALDAYPIGSIYMSVNSTSPAILFGGTWLALENRFLVGAGDTYAVNATGGEATVTLTTAQMPSHTHTQNSHNHTQDSHNHTQDSHNHTQDPHDHDQFVLANPETSNIDGRIDFNQDALDTGAFLQGVRTGDTTAQNNSTTAQNNSTTASNNSTTATNQSTGGGDSFSILPPYLAVHMWQRTA